MDEREFFPNDWHGYWRVLALGTIGIGVQFLPDKWFWPAIGISAGAALIYELVRRVNQRNDPRHAKRPPDAP
jgi:hypothetical protein